MDINRIDTLGKLKASGYTPKSIKNELRDNLLHKLTNKEETFPGIWGFEHTVIPDLERAILSRHNINLLGYVDRLKQNWQECSFFYWMNTFQ